MSEILQSPPPEGTVSVISNDVLFFKRVHLQNILKNNNIKSRNQCKYPKGKRFRLCAMRTHIQLLFKHNKKIASKGQIFLESDKAETHFSHHLMCNYFDNNLVLDDDVFKMFLADNFQVVFLKIKLYEIHKTKQFLRNT